MIFFCDRDLGNRIFTSRLTGAGVNIERHIDHFEPDALDPDWIPSVASNGWVILTNDQRMLRKQVEREAIRSSGARVIILVGGHSSAANAAQNFLNTRQKVEEFLNGRPGPFVAKLYRPNPVSLVARGKPGRIRLMHSW